MLAYLGTIRLFLIPELLVYSVCCVPQAAVITFLCSKAAGFITGSCIKVDGCMALLSDGFPKFDD